MKSLAVILLCALVFCGTRLSAQSLAPSVTATSGGYTSAPGVASLSFCVGETFTATLTGGSSMFTQGFEQPSATLSSISGPDAVCWGATIILTDAATGGTWSSSNIITATVNPVTGAVTGMWTGTVTILYTLGADTVSKLITVNPVPTAITGPSVVCAGSSVSIVDVTPGGAWSSSDSSIAIASSFGAANGVSSGVATITYTLPTGCYATHELTVAATPSPFLFTGSGALCGTGGVVTLTLAGSQPGVKYRLYRGFSLITADVRGTGGPLSFGAVTVAGMYTVLGTDTVTGCIGNIASINVFSAAAPAVYTVLGGGIVCAGGIGLHVGLDGSDPGVSYQLYRDGLPLGPPQPGTGSLIDLGEQHIAGLFTVIATDTLSGCTSPMSGSTTISVFPVPHAYFVTGGGGACVSGPGAVVRLSTSDTGVNYQLCRSLIPIPGAVLAGTGSALTFPPQNAAGNYTIVAVIGSYTVCPNTMIGSARITALPQPPLHSITGGGIFCEGGAGLHIGLSGSDTGVSYQLYAGTVPSGSALAGTGASLDFGLRTLPALYKVVATRSVTGCTRIMDSVSLSTFPAAAPFSVTGGGSYCTGDSGVPVGLGGSEAGLNYQLYLGGSPTGPPLTGTGSSLSFGLQVGAGVYTVVATNPVSGCSTPMPGSVSVEINPLPDVYSLSGTGTACAGIVFSLSGSQVGVAYQVFLSALPVGIPVAGTGSALALGIFTAPGPYTVVATNITTGCAAAMTGSFSIPEIPAPAVFAITGGGNYCLPGPGVPVGLSGSQPGVHYQLLLGGSPAGLPLAGTGSALAFTPQTTAGMYTAIATSDTTGCISTMTGSATIATYAAPDTFHMTGGGCYTGFGAPLSVGLSGSVVGITYQLYKDGIPVSGGLRTGTGSALSFGTFTTSGLYTVVASNPSTGCTRLMSGRAGIAPPPSIVSVTGGGGYCSGDPGVHVGISGSVSIYKYQLYRGGAPVDTALPGIGMALDFGPQTTAGVYTVVASFGPYCASTMAGSASVSVYSRPAVYAITGGGTYCTGGTGVHIGISGSETGITYKLYKDATLRFTCAGTGASIDFGLYDDTGTYTVTAVTGSTGCTSAMAGSAVVSVEPIPAISGASSVAVGSTTTLTASPTGGTWISASPLVAAVGSASGIVTGVAIGTTVITYTLPGGCARTASLRVTLPGGKHSSSAGIDLTGISVSPNPCNGSFVITGTSAGSDAVFTISDMSGRLLQSGHLLVNDNIIYHRVDLPPGLPGGLYLLRIAINAEITVFRLSVVR